MQLQSQNSQENNCPEVFFVIKWQVSFLTEHLLASGFLEDSIGWLIMLLNHNFVAKYACFTYGIREVVVGGKYSSWAFLIEYRY